jgi:hypothetical protein
MLSKIIQRAGSGMGRGLKAVLSSAVACGEGM